MIMLGNEEVAMDSEKVTIELLAKELEKADSKLNELSMVTTWERDINVVYKEKDNEDCKAYPWINILKIPSNESITNISNSLDNLINSGVKYNYNKTIEQIVYRGIEEEKVYGITNNPDVKAASITKWKSKGAKSILRDINKAITDLLENTKINDKEIRILIPPKQYGHIINEIAKEKQSILTYILENNIAKKKNIEFTIQPCKYCDGITKEGRMIVYIEKAISISIPQKLTRALTRENKEEKAFQTGYSALIGQVKFHDIESIRYYDGI